MGKLISHVFYSTPFDQSYYTVKDNSGPRTSPYDHPLIEQLSNRDPIWAERGKAIQSYALLEASLSDLLSSLSDTEENVAATIFYKIINSGSRNAIIAKLLRLKHGNKYNLFWNAFLKELGGVDKRRNEIVHWLSAAITILDEQKYLWIGVILIPPNYHSIISPDIAHISVRDLREFATKCDEFARLCRIFCRVTKTDRSQYKFDEWLELFQKLLTYPLAEDHLLYQMPSTVDPI